MKLYYSPGACSLSPHIVLRESGLPFDLVPANLRSHQLQDGSDYYGINPKGSVPLLELDNGERLSEGPAIVQYIADQVPEENLAPANGTMQRYRLQEWLNYITSELHKSFGAMFTPTMPAEAKALFKARLTERFGWVDTRLAGRDYLLGEHFSVADAYLYTVTRWTQPMGIDISGMPNLVAFMGRMGARPAVKAALTAESPPK